MPGFSNAPNPNRPQPGSTPESPPGGEPRPVAVVAPRPIRQGGKTRKSQTAGRPGPRAFRLPETLSIPYRDILLYTVPPGFRADVETGAMVPLVPGTPGPPGFWRVGWGEYYVPDIPGYRYEGSEMNRYNHMYWRSRGGRRSTKKRSTRRRR